MLDTWSSCANEKIPEPVEKCNGLDDNCNNQTDEGLSRPYYTGPSGTEGHGICTAGAEVCSSGSWVVGTEQVLPRQETCNTSTTTAT